MHWKTGSYLKCPWETEVVVKGEEGCHSVSNP